MLLGEPDAPAVERELDTFDRRIASRLLQVELRRVGLREDCLHDVDQFLAGVSFIAMDDEILAAAATIIPTTVATLDAIHLATAVHLSRAGELDALMTYDKQLAAGARAHNITVLSPS
jgi:predicted nucleic acid-binding protein